ncbi:cyclodeaminase/cyclohydrolase family protein [Lachnospiraceae bacterium LCP25S3_G4]
MLEKSVIDFLEKLSSDQPVPGGGGASAVVGACGTALGMMVGNLTVGKKKYVDVETDMQSYLTQLQQLREEFEQLVTEDARVFEPLSKAYGLPKNTQEELEKRNEIMEQALLEASLVPIKIMETSLKGMQVLEQLNQKGSKIAISDVGVGILFMKAALEGASLNIFINTKLMKNRVQAQHLNQAADMMIRKGRELAGEIYESVLYKIR